MTPATFLSTGGRGPGIRVDLVNDPRYPADVGDLRAHAPEPARPLGARLGQLRVRVVMNGETVTLGDHAATS